MQSITFTGRCVIDGNKMEPFATNLFVCPSCDLISSSEPAKPEIYDEKYQEKYRRYLGQDFTRELMSTRWGFLRRFLNGHKTVLDFGTATGCFLKECPFDHLELHGWDVNPFSPYHTNYVPRKPDVLTCWDVIEHIPDPVELIQDFNARLLAITTPCTDLLRMEGAILHIQDWKHYRPGEHLHYYGQKSLQALFEKSGYTVQGWNYTEGAKRNPDRNMDIISMLGERK